MKKLYPEESVQAIANAIRDKTGTIDTMEIGKMVNYIDYISNSVFDENITEITSESLINIGKNACMNYPNLLSIDLPNVKSVGYCAFRECSNLATVSLPNVNTIDDFAFAYSDSLTAIDLPKCKSINYGAFVNCHNLATVNLPNVDTIGKQAFAGCTALKEVNLGTPSLVDASAFSSNPFLEKLDIGFSPILGAGSSLYSLKQLVLRSATLCELGSSKLIRLWYHVLGKTNATYNPTGAKDGYIYVPSALIEDYKTATNWSTLASQFRALEDYTVDGTTTGELDESKI